MKIKQTKIYAGTSRVVTGFIDGTTEIEMWTHVEEKALSHLDIVRLFLMIQRFNMLSDNSLQYPECTTDTTDTSEFVCEQKSSVVIPDNEKKSDDDRQIALDSILDNWETSQHGSATDNLRWIEDSTHGSMDVHSKSPEFYSPMEASNKKHINTVLVSTKTLQMTKNKTTIEDKKVINKCDRTTEIEIYDLVKSHASYWDDLEHQNYERLKQRINHWLQSQEAASTRSLLKQTELKLKLLLTTTDLKKFSEDLVIHNIMDKVSVEFKYDLQWNGKANGSYDFAGAMAVINVGNVRSVDQKDITAVTWKNQLVNLLKRLKMRNKYMYTCMNKMLGLLHFEEAYPAMNKCALHLLVFEMTLGVVYMIKLLTKGLKMSNAQGTTPMFVKALYDYGYSLTNTAIGTGGA